MAARKGVLKGFIPHKKRQVHAADFGVLMSPPPADAEKYHILSKVAYTKPLKRADLPASKDVVSFDVGRDPEQVNMPVTFYKSGGVSIIPSRVHGTLTASVVHDNYGPWIRGIKFMQLGRTGTAVFELPKKLRSVDAVLDAIPQAKLNAEHPILLPGSLGKDTMDMRPNRTLLVFGVHPDTLKDNHLTVDTYKDVKGKTRYGFKDEYGHFYPYMIVTAPRRPEKPE